MQRLYLSKQEKGANPWDLPALIPSPKGKPKAEHKFAETLFGRRYLSVTMDEVHEV
jgi:hypothetical protein